MKINSGCKLNIKLKMFFKSLSEKCVMRSKSQNIMRGNWENDLYMCWRKDPKMR